MKKKLKAEKAARIEAEEYAAEMQPRLDAALQELTVWKKKCLDQEGIFREWAEKVHGIHEAMEKGMQQARGCNEVEINSELPAVYQVHALEPLVQVKVNEVHEKMMSAYASLQSSLRQYLPMI